MKNNKDISIVEWITHIVIVCLAINAVGESTRWWYLQGTYPGDFLIYYNAAMGVYAKGWLYKNFTSFIFDPLLMFSFYNAYTYYSGFQTICFMTLTHKLFQVKYGWIPVLFSLRAFHDLLQVGNIQITLCLVAVYSLPSILVVLIKPHYIVFSICHAIKGYWNLHGSHRIQ